ncbi:MAG: transporter [Methylococcales bacterium]|nr:transporter [Methylococcales bacterium]
MFFAKRCGVLLLFVSMQLPATESGGSNYLPGFYGDFAMAVMPDKGTFFNNFIAAYQDVQGKTGTLLEMPGILHVTGQQLFGGNYIVGIYPGVVAATDHTTNRNRFGLGDAYLIPFALNWQWGDLTALVFEGIVAPTGYYDKNALSAGRNIWTFDHNLSLTWQLPLNNELSLTIGYMNNLKNPATDYLSGDELHVDYLVGHSLHPTLAIGVTGSYYQQTSADHAPASILATERAEASTIGPVIMFTPHIIDRDVTLSLKWLHEFNIQGRDAQDYLVSRVFFAF